MVFLVLKRKTKNPQPRILYMDKLCFEYEEEIKIFLGKITEADIPFGEC